MKYSFVIPIYNDGALAEAMCKEFERVFKEYMGLEDLRGEAEIVFVDDGSKNGSGALVKKACDAYPFASLVTLSRNFGQHIAITCGYAHAKGDYVGMLNVDQEDPPDQLPLLLDAIKAKGDDYDIVGGLYSRRDVPLFSKITSYLFNVFLNRLTGYNTPTNASTARVMNRRFLTAYNSLNERNRYIPGLEMWLGFRYGYVPVRHQPRRIGKSSYNFRRRLRMATDSIISFSDFPLRLAVKVGMSVAAGGFLLALALIADKIFFTATLPGFVSTIAVIVILGGAQISVTGLVSLYVGRILAEVQGRPLYVVRERYGEGVRAGEPRGASGQEGDRPLPSVALMSDKYTEVIKANITVHSKVAAIYSKTEPHFRPENIAVVEKILKGLVAETSAKQLLDLGCGTGFMINLAKHHVGRVVGVDVTRAMLDQVDTTGPAKIELHEHDTGSFPAEAGAFDLVTAYSFLHHLYDIAPTIGTAAKALRKGGKFYADLDPNFFFWDAIKELEGKPGHDAYDPIVQREIAAVAHKDDQMNAEHGIPTAVFNDAEYGKDVAGGFKEEVVRDIVMKAGFTDVKFTYYWYLGQASVVNDASKPREERLANAALVDSVLQSVMPLSRQLYKYIGFIATK